MPERSNTPSTPVTGDRPSDGFTIDRGALSIVGDDDFPAARVIQPDLPASRYDLPYFFSLHIPSMIGDLETEIANLEQGKADVGRPVPAEVAAVWLTLFRRMRDAAVEARDALDTLPPEIAGPKEAAVSHSELSPPNPRDADWATILEMPKDELWATFGPQAKRAD